MSNTNATPGVVIKQSLFDTSRMTNNTATRLDRLLINSLEYPGCADHKVLAEEGFRNMSAFATSGKETVDELIVLTVKGVWRSIAKDIEKEPDLMDRYFAWLREGYPFLLGSTIWHSLGCPVFDLTQDFFHSIAVTDFGDGGEEPMHLPFKAFVLRFPDNTLLDGIRSAFVFPYITVAVTPAESTKLLTFDGLLDTLRTSDVAVTSNRMQLGSGKATSITGMLNWPVDDTFDSFLRGGVSKAKDSGHMRAETETHLEVSRRILGNTLLYVNSSGGVPARGSKKLGADVPVEREHKELPRFRVGRPIKLGPEIRQALTQHDVRSTWKLASKFIVRGHWRNQVCGPGRSERKKLWIHPHWKGPKDLKEALERSYSIE